MRILQKTAIRSALLIGLIQALPGAAVAGCTCFAATSTMSPQVEGYALAYARPDPRADQLRRAPSCPISDARTERNSRRPMQNADSVLSHISGVYPRPMVSSPKAELASQQGGSES